VTLPWRRAEQVADGRIAGPARGSHLRPRAAAGILVGAEAHQAGAVAEAAPLHLVVAHLDDELWADGRLLERSRAPPARLGDACVRRSLEQRADERQDLPPASGRDRARAHVAEAPAVVVEAEEERRERVRPRLPAYADDDAVCRLVLLHLDGSLARAGEVGRLDALADDAVQPGRLQTGEPLPSLRRVARGGRDGEAEQLEALAPLDQRPPPDGLARPQEEVERDEAGGRLAGQRADATLGRMQPRLQQVELEAAGLLEHDLAVERGVGRELVEQRAELGEVAQERAAVPAPYGRLGAVRLEHGPETVPLRLVLPAAAVLRQLGDELCFHRREGDVRAGLRHPVILLADRAWPGTPRLWRYGRCTPGRRSSDAAVAARRGDRDAGAGASRGRTRRRARGGRAATARRRPAARG